MWRPGDPGEIEEVTQHQVERLVPGGVVEIDRAAPPRLADHVDGDVDRAERRDRGRRPRTARRRAGARHRTARVRSRPPSRGGVRRRRPRRGRSRSRSHPAAASVRTHALADPSADSGYERVLARRARARAPITGPGASRSSWPACRRAFPSATCRVSCCSPSSGTCRPRGAPRSRSPRARSQVSASWQAHCRSVGRQTAACRPRLAVAVGQCTLVAQPARSNTRMTAADGSIWCGRAPWRAERGCAWWKLCHASPNESTPSGAKFVLWSRSVAGCLPNM